MATCLINLIDNACKYALAPKKVTVETEQISNVIYVRVTDNGPGIPVNEQERVFAPFYRSESALSRMSEGTGLGLHIAKAVAELHSGNIGAGEGRPNGSCFTLSIPVFGRA